MRTLFNETINPSQTLHETNVRTARCACGCNRLINVGDGVRVVDRGNVNGSYFRRDCLSRLGSYGEEVTTNNDAPKTSVKTTEIGQCTIGFEFEACGNTSELQKLRAILCKNGTAQPTSDCTVNVEFKTTPVTGFARHSRLLKTVQTENIIHCLDNSRCGAHIHIGNPRFTDIEHRYIERFYHSLFLELSDYLKAHETETEQLFGRKYGQWARPINENTYPQEHTNFINIQHCFRNNDSFTTLEFRLPHVVSQAQYILCAQCCREMAFRVFQWSWNFNDSLATVEKRASAKDCGKDLIKIVNKYFKKASTI